MGSHRAPSKPEPNSRAAEHTGEKATGPPAGRRQCHASHTQTGARSTGSRVTAANLHASTSAYCIGQQEEPGFRWHEHDKTQRGRLASGGGPGGGGSSTSWISRWLACPCGAAERKQRTSACANNNARHTGTQPATRQPGGRAGGGVTSLWASEWCAPAGCCRWVLRDSAAVAARATPITWRALKAEEGWVGDWLVGAGLLLVW